MGFGLFITLGALLGAAELSDQPRSTAGSARAIAAFDPADHAYRDLYALEAAAVALDVDHATPAQLPALRTAWTTLRDRALVTRIRGTDLPHPLAGRASVMLALIENMANDQPGAIAAAAQGVALLEPFRDRYQTAYAHGRTMQGFFKFLAGDTAGALVILEPNVAFFQAYYDALPPAARTKEIEIQRADGEYALGGALARIGKLDQAAAAQKRSSEAIAAGLGPDDGNALLAQANYAVLLGRAGHIDAAEAIARRAVERATAVLPHTNPDYPRVMAFTGLMLARNGRRVLGSDYLSTALATMRETNSNNSLSYRQFQQAYGSTLFERDLHAQALTQLSAATNGFRAANSPIDVAKGQSLIGLARFAEGDATAAALELSAALGASRAKDNVSREISQVSFPLLIVATLDGGRVAEARGYANQFAADVALLEGAQAFLVADAAALSGYVAMREDKARRADAIAAAHRLIATVSDNRLLAAAGELPQRERAALDLTLRIASEADDPALGLAALTVLAGSRIAQANRLLIERQTVADTALATHIRDLQDAIRAAQTADSEFLSALATGQSVPERRAGRDATATRVAQLRAALVRDYPRWDEANAVAPSTLGALQAGLMRGEAILGVMPAFDGVYLLAISAQGATIRRATATRAQIYALIGRLRTSLPIGAFDTAAAHELYRTIFVPPVAAELRDATSLRIVATGAIASLPFALLLERPVKKPDRSAPYLLRHYALHNASSFALSAPRSASANSGRFLGIGAPTPFVQPTASAAPALLSVAAARTYFRGGDGDPATLATLPLLPASLDELRAVSRQLGAGKSTLLTGDHASEASLRAMDLTPYSVLLFATHGLISGEMEGVTEPALVLASPAAPADGDGLLKASEIATLRLAADWVILSACNTAAGDEAAAPAYSGMAQAFRYAGARSLLLSHWPVRDDAAARISIATVRNARNGLAREVALQHAMLDLLDDRTTRDASDPYIWAPYVLVD